MDSRLQGLGDVSKPPATVPEELERMVAPLRAADIAELLNALPPNKSAAVMSNLLFDVTGLIIYFSVAYAILRATLL